MYKVLNITIVFILAISISYQTFTTARAQTSLDAQVSLGDMKVSDEVRITMVDGSELTLKDESYPIYPDMIINTLDNGRATLIVKGGKYVIEPGSVFKVQSIGEGHTGLLLTQGDQGEVCYCFNPKGGYLVDTPDADTIPADSSAVPAGMPEYVDGRTNVTNSITYALQLDGYSDFKTASTSQTLEPGDATSNPQQQNPYEAFDNKSGCCTPAAAPLLIPAAVGAAAVTGAIIGATTGNDNDSTASEVIRSAE